MKKGRISLLAIILCILFSFLISSSNAFGQKKKSTKPTTTEAITSLVPYSLEVNEESTKKGLIITLATDRVTIIRCPEEPLQVLFGNSEGIDINETKPGRTEIYLRPKLAQISTNVVVEMASGPVVLYLKTVEVKGGARVGQFTSEVIIKNSAYKEALIATKEELQKANNNINTLKEEIKALESKLVEKSVSECQESKTSFLRIAESLTQFNQIKNTINTLGGKVKVSQLGKLQPVKDGYLLTVLVENRDKDFVGFEALSITGFEVLSTSIGNTRKISAKGEGKFCFFIEMPKDSISGTENKENLPKEAIVVINQTPVNLKIS